MRDNQQRQSVSIRNWRRGAVIVATIGVIAATLALPEVASATGPPTVTSVTPASGSTSGGTSVTIAGTGFVSPASGDTVDFGSTPATSVTYNAGASGSISLVGSAHTAGRNSHL
jgi:hypothetical protein